MNKFILFYVPIRYIFVLINHKIIAMRTFKQIATAYNKKRAADIKAKRNTVPWPVGIIGPIVRDLCEIWNATTDGDLRNYGLRFHVPVTFNREGKKSIYLDFEADFSGNIRLTDFSKPSTKEYKPGTIGEINGFNYQTLDFEPHQTAADIAEYINKHPKGFILNK